jgi:hypothetical protein
LNRANAYSGDTTVAAGTLRLHHGSLADGADVHLANGAVLDLAFSGIDTIDSLLIDGTSQSIGTWGSLTSAAENKSPLFAGDGILQVTSFVAPALLVGDYNENGVVDAADFTLWRDVFGTSASLANRDPQNSGEVSSADYDSWRNNFGAARASVAALVQLKTVPEPSALIMAAVCGLLFAADRGSCAASPR